MISFTTRLNCKGASKIWRQHKDSIWLSLIVILGFLVRVIGLKFGYPFLTHPDESYIIESAVDMTINRTFDPGMANRPDLFLINFNLVFLNIVSYIKFGDLLNVTYSNVPTFFHHASRVVIAFIGSLLPIVAWKIGKEGRVDFSFPAAIFFAFFPAYVTHSHYITPDVTITLFSMAIILFSIKYAKSGQGKFLYIATFLSVLNTSEKYPGIISFALIATAILYRIFQQPAQSILESIKKAIPQILKFGLLFLITLYIIAPTLFIFYDRTITALMVEARTTHFGQVNLGWAGNLAFYVRAFFVDSGWVIAVLIIPGAILAVKRQELVVIFSSYGFLYWLLLSILPLHWERWALPMYIAPLILVAYGIAAAPTLFPHTPKIGNLISLFFVTAIGLQLFITSFSNSITMTYQDTRYSALIYCQNNGITPENSIYEGYTPFSPTYRVNYNIHDIYQSGFRADYIILSSNVYTRYTDEPERYTQQIENYKSIRAENELVAKYSAFTSDKKNFASKFDTIFYYLRRNIGSDSQVRLSGPTIEIYDWE
ncbi:MAG: glycosyltransferase family 39 protein [Bacillota bacterium]